jgi:tetratricopeptide (TPR) repeat protein
LEEIHEKLFETGLYEEAGNQFEVLCRDVKYAQNPVVHMNLARCYQEQKRWKEAKDCLLISEKLYQTMS